MFNDCLYRRYIGMEPYPLYMHTPTPKSYIINLVLCARSRASEKRKPNEENLHAMLSGHSPS